jgi:hypothetical protein
MLLLGVVTVLLRVHSVFGLPTTFTCQNVSGTWALGEDFYFYVDQVNNTRTWSAAQSLCQVMWKLNSTNPINLAIVNSTYNANLIRQFNQTGTTTRWIGAYQLSTGQEPAGSWFFVDSNSVDFVATPWYSGYPRDVTMNQDCGVIVTQTSSNLPGYLASNTCTVRLSYVCAIPGNYPRMFVLS